MLSKDLGFLDFGKFARGDIQIESRAGGRAYRIAKIDPQRGAAATEPFCQPRAGRLTKFTASAGEEVAADGDVDKLTIVGQPEEMKHVRQ